MAMSAVGQRALERRANAVEIARHRDVEGHQLPAFGVEEIDVGLSDLDADDVGAPRRAHDRVGDHGIGHQHVLDVARQVDDDALAHAERDELRRLVAVDLDGGSEHLPAGSAAVTGVERPSNVMTISAAEVAVRISVAFVMELLL